MSSIFSGRLSAGVLTIASVIALACQGAGDGQQTARTVTRASAKAVLNNNTDFRQPIADLPLVAPDEACVKEGYCRPDGTLTDEGRRHFRNPPQKGRNLIGARFTLAEPVRRSVVSVTGVEATGDVRQVEFRWSYEGLSDVAQRYSGESGIAHKSVAYFKQYDDGWRAVQIHDEPTPLADFVWDTARLATWEAAERARADARRMARTPTHTIASYEFTVPPDPYPSPNYALTIKDNGFSVTTVSALSAQTNDYISYGDCERPRLSGQNRFYTKPGRYEGWKRIGDEERCSFMTEIYFPDCEVGNVGVYGMRIKAGGDVRKGEPCPEQDPVMAEAFKQFLAAYDAWRSKHPEYVTKRD